MGNNRKQGTTSSENNKEAGDAGTSCLTQSPLAGITGADAGTPPRVLTEKDKAVIERMETFILFIEGTPFGRKPEGRDIVKALRELNEMGNIIFANTGSGRGDWDGEVIRVSDNYEYREPIIIVELVHEGTHAVFRKHNPPVPCVPADVKKTIADELNSQLNQLEMYEYVRKLMRAAPDPDLEMRLELRKTHKLKAFVEDQFIKPASPASVP